MLLVQLEFDTSRFLKEAVILHELAGNHIIPVIFATEWMAPLVINKIKSVLTNVKLCCCSSLNIGCAAINNQQSEVKNDEREVKRELTFIPMFFLITSKNIRIKIDIPIE